MRKIMILTLVIGLVAGVTNAQKFYGRIGIGPEVGLCYYNGYFGDYTITSTSDVQKVKNGSLGSGFNVNLGFGFMFSKYVGLDLGLNQFIGFGIKSNYSNTQSTYSMESDHKISAKMFQIVPAIVITPGLEKINPYARLGLILGVMNRISYTYSQTATNVPYLKETFTEDSKEIDRGGVALGCAAALGVDFVLSEMVSLYAEIDLNALNYAPTKGKYKEWTIDGVDQLPDATTKEKEWEYVKELDYDEDIPDGSPDKYLKESAVLTNVGINFGVKFKFGSSK